MRCLRSWAWRGLGIRLSCATAYNRFVDYRQYIEIVEGKRSGKPCVVGTRITVQDVLDYLAGGMSEDEITTDFPALSHESIRACLAFAADRERRLSTTAL